MTGEKFKIQHLGALVAGVHSRGKFWSTDLLEWNRGPGHLKRAFKIRQKFTNLVFLPFAWMEVRNAHTVLDPTLAWLSRRVSSELLDGVFYRVACDAGVPICRTRCDAGEFLDANEFPSPDRQTQANKVDISHSGEFHQKRTGGQISQRELDIRERESKLSFGVQRGFYDPSGVHLDTTLPRPNLARNQTRISMNIDESAGGRRACLGHWAQQTTWHRSVVSSPEAPQVGMHHFCFNTLVLTPYSGKARNDRSGALPPLLSLTYLSASTSMLTATAAATAAHPPRLAQVIEQLTCLFQAVGVANDKTTRLPPAPASAVTHARAVRAGHARKDDVRASSVRAPSHTYLSASTLPITPDDRVAGGSASMSTATAANPPRLVYETHFHRIVPSQRCPQGAPPMPLRHGPFSTVRIEIAVALPSAKRFVSPLA
ncbi:hypothetical protein C8R46DRAFT_1042145 [Mycena filopes]|nr:hypothetical protein C8R46DRAFT_1042145 [Mycena filopes]